VTPWIIAGFVILVIVGVAWGRVHSARSERRSMENYGHGLAALGDVAKRTGPSASVRVLPRADTGRTHVRTDVPSRPHDHDDDTSPRRPASGRRPAGSGRLYDGRRPDGDDRPNAEDRAVPQPEVAGQSWLSGLRDRPAPVPTSDEAPEPPAPAQPASSIAPPIAPEALPTGPVVMARPQLSISPDELRRQATVRRLSVGSVATLGVLAIVTAGVLMTGSSPKPKPVTASHTHTPPPSTATTTTRVTTTTAPSVTPESVSGNDVTFKVPSGHYTLSFSGVGGACWVGVETGLGSGTYLWNQTVEAGTTASYKASGPLAVALGAPEFVAITVNGVPVKIPKGVTADNLVFASG
jgi:hypothetical protein